MLFCKTIRFIKYCVFINIIFMICGPNSLLYALSKTIYPSGSYSTGRIHYYLGSYYKDDGYVATGDPADAGQTRGWMQFALPSNIQTDAQISDVKLYGYVDDTWGTTNNTVLVKSLNHMSSSPQSTTNANTIWSAIPNGTQYASKSFTSTGLQTITSITTSDFQTRLNNGYTYFAIGFQMSGGENGTDEVLFRGYNDTSPDRRPYLTITYTVPGSISVTSTPSGASFSLSGAGSYSGTTPWSTSTAPPGSYTITWNNITGYTKPSSSSQTLPDDGSISFSGTYTSGSISVASEPSGAGFSLGGAASYSGTTPWSNSPSPTGSYTITWNSMSGYSKPSSSTKSLSNGSNISFSGQYSQGGISVNSTPSGASFNLSGAASYSGTTPWSNSSAPAGSYSITWNSMTDYTKPSDTSQSLSDGSNITFSGTYTSGSISVDSSPSGASFSLSGAYSYNGTAPWSKSPAPTGSYTIAWGDMSGYTKPSSESQTLSNSSSLTFNGTYVAAPITINVNTTRSDATFDLSGPANYSGSGISWTKSDAPAGTYTISYGNVAGYDKPTSESKAGSPGQSITFTGTYTLKKPDPPTNLSGTAVSVSQIDWLWTDVAINEVGYRVHDTNSNIKVDNLSANVQSWSETSLVANTQYTRHVHAYNSAGESNPSSSYSRYTLANSPSSLVKSAVTENSISIAWTGTATRFSIERALDSSGSPGTWLPIVEWTNNLTATSYTNTSLNAETIYWYRVKSYNGDGIINATPSNQISVLTAPPKPTNLFANNITTYSVTWNWTDIATAETGYRIHDNNHTELTSLSASTTFWMERPLNSNTAYTRHIQVYNSSGNSESSDLTKYTLARIPSGLTSVNTSSSNVQISWTGNGTRYAVERANNNNGTPDVWGQIKSWADNINSTNYTDTSLTPETTYWYRVLSYNGDQLINSTPSENISVLTTPPVPTNFSAVATSTNTIMWLWKDNANFELGYKIYDNNDNLKASLSSNTTYWIQESLTANTSSNLHVQVYNNAGITNTTNLPKYTLAKSPGGLYKVSSTTDTVTLSWGNAGAAKYAVERSSDGVNWFYVQQWNNNLTETIFIDHGLSVETNYWYRTKSYNVDGDINPAGSNEISIITGPKPATIFSGTVLSTTNVLWNWTDNSLTEEGYRVYTDTNGLLFSLNPNVTSWTENALLPNTKYTRYVNVYNSSGTSNSSTYEICTLAVPPPTSNKTNGTDTTNTLSWNESGATRYAVERSSDGSNWFYIKQWPDNLSSTSIVDSSLVAETSYWYKIRAYNQQGVINTQQSSDAMLTRTAPKPAQNLTGISPTSTSIIWSWNDITHEETGHRVYTNTDIISINLTVDTTFYLEANLKPNTTYARYVQVYNSNGTSNSSTITQRTLSSPPTNLRANSITSTDVSLLWDTDGSAVSYKIERTQDISGNTGWQTVKDREVSTSYLDFGLTPGTTYCYRIKSYNTDDIINDSANNILTLPTIPSSAIDYYGLALSQTAIHWLWTDVTNSEDGYRVYTASDSTPVSIRLQSNTTYWIEYGLQPNTLYSRKVNSYNVSGSSSSEVWNTYTYASIPTDLVVSSITATSISLSWQGNGSRYSIMRSTNNESWNSVLPDHTTLQFTDNNLKRETIYYYRVYSKNGNGIIYSTQDYQFISMQTVGIGLSKVYSLTHPNETKYYGNYSPVIEWSPPDDPVGISGYYYILSSSVVTNSNEGIWLYTTDTKVRYDLVPDGVWYFGIVACDTTGTRSRNIAKFQVNIKTYCAPGADTNLEIANGTELLIPSDAITEPVQIKISSWTLDSAQCPQVPYDTLTRGSNIIRELKVTTGSSQFNKDLTLVILYTDQEIQGLKEERLKLFYAKNGTWVLIPNSEVKPLENKIIAKLNHFSLFRIMEYTPPVDSIQELSNYPNPFNAGKDTTRIRYTLKNNSEVKIKIYDLAGHLVWQTTCASGDIGGMMGPNEIVWTGKTNDDRYVAVGSYICQITCGNLNLKTKIGVR